MRRTRRRTARSRRSTNFSVLRAQKEVGRSKYGAIFVGKYATDDELSWPTNKWNRAYGVDADIQMSGPTSGYRSSSPARIHPATTGSDQAGRAFYNFTNNLWQVSGGYSQVGERFNPEVGFLPRRGYRRPEFRPVLPVATEDRRVDSPCLSPHYLEQRVLRPGRRRFRARPSHMHPFEIQPAYGGRFGWFIDRNQDRPTQPFIVFDRDGQQVVIPPGLYTWWQNGFEFQHNPSAPVTALVRYRLGHYYDGDYNSIEIASDYRFSAAFTASLGWTRQDASLPSGSFVTHLVPIKVIYSFTPLASVSALLQHNGQTGQFSSNVRLAILNRSGTGLFIVYNDRRDTHRLHVARDAGTIVCGEVHTFD